MVGGPPYRHVARVLLIPLHATTLVKVAGAKKSNPCVLILCTRKCSPILRKPDLRPRGPAPAFRKLRELAGVGREWLIVVRLPLVVRRSLPGGHELPKFP